MRGVLIDAPDAPGGGAATAFDPTLPWRRARAVALRPEPFGALAYHFGTRKLSFLKSQTLVRVVEALGDHPSAAATLVACDVPEGQRPGYVTALARLARAQMIELRAGATTSVCPDARPLASGPGSEALPDEDHRRRA